MLKIIFLVIKLRAKIAKLKADSLIDLNKDIRER